MTDDGAVRMHPIELRSRRGALGMDQHALAVALGNRQSTVSAWELGTRAIPAGVDGQLDELEDQLEGLVGDMVDACEMVGPGAALITFGEDDALHSAHPELDGWPAALHRVACARAAAELRSGGLRVPIITKP